MKTSKKMLSLLLIAAMLVSVLCMGVSATEDYDPVSISEGEPVTISWNGTTGTVVSVDGSSYIPQLPVIQVSKQVRSGQASAGMAGLGSMGGLDHAHTDLAGFFL